MLMSLGDMYVLLFKPFSAISFVKKISDAVWKKIRGSLVLVGDLSLRIYLTYLFLRLGHRQGLFPT